MGDFNFNFNANHQLENASQSRYMIWFSGVHIIQDHPWGIGQGNLPDIYPQYRMPNGDLEPTVPHLHNNFLQICAQNGWQGLAAYLFWIFAFYWAALRAKLLSEKVQELNWGLICVFSAILVWGLTEYTFSHQFMYVQFFLLGLQLELLRVSSISK
jgi:O-antigen ligase